MKKTLALSLLFAVVLSGIFAFAAETRFENCAETLNSLGLLLGDGTGFNLEAVPTRAQAGVMLIRLLGLEETALASEYNHPFTDVPAWAEKYAGYLFESGLSKGVSETEFGSNNNCDVRMYTTFVLRALGYDDAAGDFRYEDAVSFGTMTGIVDPVIADGDFMRDNMAAISYLGLFAQPKNRVADTLLDKLVAEGAVSAAAAQPILDQFKLYNEFSAAISTFNKENKIEMAASMLIDVTIAGEKTSTLTEMTIKTHIDDSGSAELAGIGITNTMGETRDMEMYYTGGYFYINMFGAKMKSDMGLEAALRQAGAYNAQIDALYSLKGIKKTVVGETSLYEIEYSHPSFSSMAISLLAGLELSLGNGLDIEFSFKDISYTGKIDNSGSFTGMDISMLVDASVSIGNETFPMSCEYGIETNVVAVGDGVVITMPNDLDTYPLTGTP